MALYRQSIITDSVNILSYIQPNKYEILEIAEKMLKARLNEETFEKVKTEFQYILNFFREFDIYIDTKGD